MTVFDAERLVRRYWSEPVRSPLLEAARRDRVIAEIAWGLPSDESRRVLYARLGFRLAPSLKNVPILTLLAERIDRRERMGIEIIEPNAEQRYRKRGKETRGIPA